MRRPLGSVALLLGIACSLVFAGGASAAFPGTNGRVVFVSNRDGSQEIYSANADGSDPKRLTTNLVRTRAGVLAGRVEDRLHTQRRHLGDERRRHRQAAVTGVEGPDSEPAWSPDGTQIVYVSNQTAVGGGTTGPELFVRNVHGSGSLRRVTDTTTGASRAPAWSPDGATIAYESNSDGTLEVFTIPAATTAGTGTRR